MSGEKKEKLGADTKVSVAELASLLGLGADRIYQLIRGGTLQTVTRGHLLLADSLQRYISCIRREPVSDEDMKLERTKRAAEVTLKASRAKVARMEADELEGKMHRSEDVAALTEDLLYAIRDSLTALPGRLAVDTARAETAAETAEIIKREVYLVMKDLSAYNYDPKKYAKRVRDRMDWHEDDDDDE